MPKRFFFYIFLLFCFIVFTSYTITLYIQITQKDEKPILIKDEILSSMPIRPKTKITKLFPSNPSRFGIISLDSKNTPRTKEEWESLVQKILNDSNFAEEIPSPITLKESRSNPFALNKIKTSQKNFNDLILRLNGRIEYFENMPYNEALDKSHIEMQLHNLYILKALANFMENKIIDQSK